MDDEGMKRFNDQWRSITNDIRADERKRITEILIQTLNQLADAEPQPDSQPSEPPIAEPARPKRGRKAKPISAGAADMAQVEAAVLNGLKRWSEPQRPTARDLAQFVGIERPVVSKALKTLGDNGLVNHTGVKGGMRYFIPIAASRNSDHAEA